jgi:transposase
MNGFLSYLFRMYIATVPNRKSPPAILLRESYRDQGKVKTRTIANLSHWAPDRIEALRKALKGDFDGMDGEALSGEIFGVLFALKQLADQVGMTRVLGPSEEGRLALFLILARIAHAGSRLSAVRWAEQHAVSDLLDLEDFDENDLYAALDWLAAEQRRIEQELYQRYVEDQGTPPAIVLYDVTSSYFEGEQNELADYGYNRDGKKGKRQIVIGLLSGADGEPLAVRVFEGNTADPSTVTKQIELLKQQFGVAEVVFIGDRGMLKTKGKAALGAEGWRYISALTKPQIRALLSKGVLQPDLFDEDIGEVVQEGKRLITRRNEAMQKRMRARRADKLQQLERLIVERNAFVSQSTRADPAAGLRQLEQWTKRYKLHGFVTLSLEQDQIRCTIDQDQLHEAALLDGCYVLETTVLSATMDRQTIDERYRDLQQVERNFRTMKTDFLEVRPIFLRNGERTKAHVFVAMLALKITRRFQSLLHQAFGTTDDDPLAMTPDDALQALGRLTYLIYDVKGRRYARLIQPDDEQRTLLDALGLRFPRQTAKAL